MKISEILCERISTSALHRPVSVAVKSAFVETVYKCLQHNVTDADSLETILSTLLERNMSNVAEKFGLDNVSINWEKEMPMSTRGQANTINDYGFPVNVIELNYNRFIKRYVQAFTELLDIVKKDSKVTELSNTPWSSTVYVKMLNELNNYWTGAVFDQLTETVLHELTHLLQHVPQQNKIDSGKLTDYEYKDSHSKRRFNTDKTDTKYTYKYLSIPQEVDAFAQGLVSNILSKVKADEVDFNDKPAIKNLINSIVQELNTLKKNPEAYATGYSKLVFNREIKIDSKVLNRFYKKVYLELTDYIGRLKNEL
jgi:hypothetical protein